MPKTLIEQLQASRVFKNMPQLALEGLLKIMKAERFAAGQVLFKRGDPGDSLYLIVSGKIRIFTYDETGNEITLSFLGESRIFGDFSVLDNQPRSASAQAAEPTECLILYRADFQAYIYANPVVGLAMMRNIAEQVRLITDFLSHVNSAVERLSRGELDQAVAELESHINDDELETLVSTFIEMVQQVRARQTTR